MKFGLAVFLVLALAMTTVSAKLCTTKALCVCDTAKGRIDLSDLAEQKFNITDGKYFYRYSPCKLFSQGKNCNNVVACQTVPIAPVTDTPLASDSNYDYELNKDGDTVITYTTPKSTMIVTFVCDPNQEGDFTKLPDNGQQNVYNFNMSTKYMCQSSGTTTEEPVTTTSPDQPASSSPASDQSSTTPAQPSTTPGAPGSSTKPSSSSTSQEPASSTPVHPDSSSTTPGGPTTPHNGTTGPSSPTTSPNTPTRTSPNTPTTMTTQSTTSGGSILSPLAALTLAIAAMSKILN